MAKETVRLNIPLAKSDHAAAKIAAIEAGLTLQQFVINSLRLTCKERQWNVAKNVPVKN